jgi:hypothetical protein
MSENADLVRRAIDYFGKTGDFRDVWAEWAFEADAFIEGAHAVVVPLLFRVRCQSGVELVIEETWAYWLRDGKIRRVEQHGTEQAALKAAGLED